MGTVEIVRASGEAGRRQLSGKDATLADILLKEIRSRIGFLIDVGLDYLDLSRATTTLSGGETQRVRLATQIGASLVGVLRSMKPSPATPKFSMATL